MLSWHLVNSRRSGRRWERSAVVRKGWVEANRLKLGDKLSSHDGQWIAVEEVYDTGEYETLWKKVSGPFFDRRLGSLTYRT